MVKRILKLVFDRNGVREFLGGISVSEGEGILREFVSFCRLSASKMSPLNLFKHCALRIWGGGEV